MAVIEAVLNLILSILEFLFSTPPKESGRHDFSNSSQTPQQQEASLQAALDFFELDAFTLSRESLKKKFRRYSLLHHPDRNGNSQESKHEMQKVNNFYNILNEELDAREGIHHDDINEDQENTEPTKPQDQDDDKQSSPKNKKQSKQAKKRQRRRARRRNDTNTKQEMRQEQANVRKQRVKVKREEEKLAKQVQETKIRHGLDTKRGRTHAFHEWKQALDSMQQENNSDDGTADTAASSTTSAATGTPDTKGNLDDIDDDDQETAAMHTESNNKDKDSKPHKSDPSVSTTESSVPVDTKPINLVMECCLEEIVIAMRMGLTDVVISLIQSEIEECIASVFSKAYLNGESNVRESNVAQLVATYFTRALDDDGNTLLHYSVYYSNADIISVIYHFAGTFGIISQVFLHANDYGMMAVDYSMGSRDPSIAQLMTSYTNAAKAQEESKKLLPLLKKSARRLYNILSNLQLSSLVRPMNFALSYGIGSHLFGCSRIISFLLALFPPFSMMEPEDEMKLDYKRAYAATLFAVHWTWRCYRYIFGFLPWLAWFVLSFFPMFAWHKWNMEYALTALSIPLLLVFTPLFYMLDFLDKSLPLSKWIGRNEQLERASSLVVFAMSFLLMKHATVYCYGEYSPNVLGDHDYQECGEEQEVVVEPELRTLFRDL